MKYIVRSAIILLALYGVAFAILDALLVGEHASLWFALAFAVGFIGFQYLISPLVIDRVMRIDWTGAEGLPAANRTFVEKLCAERNLKAPRIGIIDSSAPNAFSYGHTPADARVVISRGLLDLLTPEESSAVLAHEIGHVEHWDFVVIMVAALVPLLLYQIYAFARGQSNHARVVAFSAYAAYCLTQFVVLLLNRTREYFADHYSAEVTGDPNALSSALVKIACGMVVSDGEIRKAAKGNRQARRAGQLQGALALMGISSLSGGSALVLSGANTAGAAEVMRWDLTNPWARLYEMNSTHPLTALRVRALNAEAESLHQPGGYPLADEQKVRWGNFPFELLVWAAPWVCVGSIALLVWFPTLGRHLPTLPVLAEPAVLMAGGVLWLVRIWYRYRGNFTPANIGSLIEDTLVSQMQPRAARLEGEILGQGVPGAFWSADLVLRDATGILYVLYRPSIPFARLVFALGKLNEFIGEKVTIDGWYRRGMRPYIEMSHIRTMDGQSHRSYSRWIQCAMAVTLIAAGCWWFNLRLHGVSVW